MSIHSIKKDAYARIGTDGTQAVITYTLYDYYVEVSFFSLASPHFLLLTLPLSQTYGPPESAKFRKAQTNFIKSLASYSVICYLLQLKDRHNGNILVDRDGHLIRSWRILRSLLPR